MSAARVQDASGAQASLDTFTGLRGICAPFIVLHHALAMAGGPVIFSSGFFALSIFGGISGFVLARANAARFDAGLKPAEFLRRRILRLYPTILVAHLLTLPLLVKAGLGTAVGLPLSLALLPDPFTSMLYPLNPPLWWLLFDLVANALLAVLWPRLTNRLLAVLIVGGAVVTMALQLTTGVEDGGFDWRTFAMGFGRIICAFFIGVALTRVRLRAPKVSPWLLIAVLIAACAAHPPAALRPLFDLVGALIFVPVMLWLALAAEPGPLTRPLFRFLGAVSFPLYVIHSPIMTTAARVFAHFHLPVRLWAFLALFPLIVALSWAVHSYVEIPVAVWFSRRRAARAGGGRQSAVVGGPGAPAAA